MLHLPTIVALRCLDASARHRSFTRAAAELHLTQGAVSHQILGLERHLGVALFVRRREGLLLTPVGESYWHEVRSALRQLERAGQDVKTHGGRGGAVTVCVASSLATYWLMPRLGDFVAKHPEVTLNVSTHIGPVNFAASPYDASIEYCDGGGDGLQSQLVMPLRLRPYAARSLIGSPRAARGDSTRTLRRLLREHALIQHTTVPEAWPAWLAASGLSDEIGAVPLRAGPRYDLLSMALNAAVSGIGIALLPDFMTHDVIRRRKLVPLSAVSFTSAKGYYWRFPRERGVLPALQSFGSWLREEADGEASNAPG